MAKLNSEKRTKTVAKKRKANARSKAPVSLKKRPSRSLSKPASHIVGRFLIPLFILVTLAIAIAFMAFSGYQNVTASKFFALKDVEVSGVQRTSAEDIRRIVTTEVEKPGVWNSDLVAIQDKIEKFPFVKTATVSRSLPSGIHVSIVERTPAALVTLTSGVYLVDSEGNILTAAKGDQKDFPFVLKGWNEAKTLEGSAENVARLKLYKKMLEEWQQFDLSTRVKEVNLSNPRQPVASVEDSGRIVGITLARDNLGKGLKTAIEALTGKGDRVKSIDSAGVYPVIQYLDF